MEDKRFVPKWKQQEIEREEAQKKLMKKKHKYNPVKVKGKSFSTLTGKYFNPLHHQQPNPTHPEEPQQPLILNLNIYERNQAAKMFKSNYFSQTMVSSRG